MAEDFTPGQLAIIKLTAQEAARAAVKEYAESLPKRPCPDYIGLERKVDGIIASQKEQSGNWKRAITGSFVHIAEMCLIGMVIYCVAHALQKSAGGVP